MKQQKKICFELRIVSNLIKRHINNSDGIKKIEHITGTHAWAIGYLYKNKDRDIFQKDLENEFSIRRSTVTKILQLMERNGLISRVPVDHDARLKKIVLTDKALTAHMIMEQELAETEKILQQNLTDEELCAFFNTIEKIKTNLSTERSCDCL